MNPLKAAVATSLALAIIVSSAWVQPEAQEGLVRLTPKMVWAAKRSNVRTGPGTQYDKVDLLEVGRKVVVTGQVGKWFRIREGGGHAFVYGPLLSSSPPGSQPRGDTRRVAAPRSQAPPSRQGRQVLTYKNGRYEGQVRNGKEHGQGTYTWTSGSRYEGDFVDGDFHGRGTYTWADGNRYEGEWRNDKRTGRGIYTWATGKWKGDRYEGDFVDGKRTGWGTHVSANGKVREGEWRDSKLVKPSARMQRQQGMERQREEAEWQRELAEEMAEFDREQAMRRRTNAVISNSVNRMGDTIQQFNQQMDQHRRHQQLIQQSEEQNRLLRDLANRASRTGTRAGVGVNCRDPELSCARHDAECQRRWGSLPPCFDPNRPAPPSTEDVGFCVDMRTGDVDRECLRRRGQ